MVAGLRKMEEEKLDEELDMLREMEAMEHGGGGDMGPPPPKKKTTPPPPSEAEKKQSSPARFEEEGPEGVPDFDDDEAALIEVEASFLESPSSKRKKERQQRPVLLSGFDDENVYDSQDDGDLSKEGLDRNGQPLRVFKKKGQKRTTRKVNMRPTRTKRPSAPVGKEEDDSEDEVGEDVIPETQFDATKNVAGGDDQDDLLLSGSGSEFDGSDGEDDEEAEASKTKAAKKKAPAAKEKEKEKKDAAATKKKEKAKKKASKEEGDDEKPAKKPRMVKATANANFKRLKLKNNGAKGGPAHNSRFRRRR